MDAIFDQKPQRKVNYITIVLIFKVFNYIPIICNLIIPSGIAHTCSLFNKLQIMFLNSLFWKICLN